MPYDNEYNRKIKREYENINRRYVEHQKLNDQLFLQIPMVSGLANKNFEGGAIPKNLNSDVDFGVNQGSRIVYGDASQYGSNFGEKDATDDKLNYIENLDKEAPMKGGAGFARGTFRDTGFERVLGAGKKSKGGVKMYKKEPLKLTKVVGGAKRRGRPSKMVGGTELGLPQNLVQAVPKVKKIKVKEPKVKAPKVKEPKVKKAKVKKAKEIEKIIEESKDVEKTKDEPMEGKGFLSSLWKGIKTVAKPLASVAKVGLSMTPLPQAQLAAAGLDALGAGKRRGRPSKMKGGKLVPVENMKSSSMAGQGKPKINKRADIVKKIMKEKKLSMIEASKYVKEHKLYVK
jgi:hypothetical protein